MFDFLVHPIVRGKYSAIYIRALKQYRTRGFTLIELIAVTAVISLISGLLLVSNSTFGGKVLLENLAYDIALSIRQAQVYGISVQRFSTNTFSAAYGVHLDRTSAASYATFADALTTNGLYDCPTPGSNATCELVQSTSIERGFRISKLCVPAGSSSATCTSVNPVDIAFKRPEPDACISVGGIAGVSVVNGSPQCTSIYESVRIVLTSPRGDTTSVVVEKNGQISVQKN